jgi:type I restriction enzyme R subunit
VLGFDPYKVLTYKDMDLRKAVAIDEANAKDEDEAISDQAKSKIYYHFLNELDMAGSHDAGGVYIKGIEDYPEAIDYYRLIKNKKPVLKVTALFDPHINDDNVNTTAFKEAGLVEIVTDYNACYNQCFDLGSHARFKKDITARLAHKEPYKRIELEPEKQIDLLIVVDQMLTGFDSKWINTLYMDKILEYHGIIQAFSRTNRLFGHEKPFGTIRYYRKPHTIEKNIEKAVKLYSGDKTLGLFVPKLKENLEAMNVQYGFIKKVFADANVSDFTKNPKD